MDSNVTPMVAMLADEKKSRRLLEVDSSAPLRRKVNLLEHFTLECENASAVLILTRAAINKQADK